MRLQNIYDSIPDAIDRVVEEVVAKYEWVDVENEYVNSPHEIFMTAIQRKNFLLARQQRLSQTSIDIISIQQRAAMGDGFRGIGSGGGLTGVFGGLP